MSTIQQTGAILAQHFHHCKISASMIHLARWATPPGLHFEDIRLLLNVLHKLVERGNTVVVIEHNLDAVKTADYALNLGSEGGDEGGRIVTSGTPEEVAKTRGSYTGAFLRDIIKTHAENGNSKKKRTEKFALAL